MLARHDSRAFGTMRWTSPTCTVRVVQGDERVGATAMRVAEVPEEAVDGVGVM